MKYVLFLITVLLTSSLLVSQSNVHEYRNFADFEKEILNRSGDSVYVINFWATWCKPCVKELPFFDRIKSEYADKKVKVILVSLDDRRYVEDRLVPFIQNRNVQSEVVLMSVPDANSWIDKVDTEWSGSIPATVFYNNKKRMFKEEEFEAYSDLENIVKSFIN